MKIADIKINGMKNPTGFHFDSVRVSWKVRDSASSKQKNVNIQVSLTDDFGEILYEKNGTDLCQAGEILEMNLEPRTRYFVRVTVMGNTGDKAVSTPAYFETGKMEEPWQARWITTEPEYKFHPVFFKEFQLEQKVRSARLYISGLGLFQAELNGRKVGDEFLKP